MTKDDSDGQLTERLIFPASKAMVEQIKEYRFEHRCETKSEAIRRLIEAGLRAERSRGKK